MFGREMLKWLAALGTGVASVIAAYLGNVTPPEGSDGITAVVIGLVIALLKRGIDYLIAKIPSEPAPVARTARRRNGVNRDPGLGRPDSVDRPTSPGA